MKKYLVCYFYCHRIGAWKNQKYFIYPKPYAGLIDETTYRKLQQNDTFICTTKVKGAKKPIRSRCFIFNLNKATKYDLKTYKNIKEFSVAPAFSGQRKALEQFKRNKLGIA